MAGAAARAADVPCGSGARCVLCVVAIADGVRVTFCHSVVRAWARSVCERRWRVGGLCVLTRRDMLFVESKTKLYFHTMSTDKLTIQTTLPMTLSQAFSNSHTSQQLSTCLSLGTNHAYAPHARPATSSQRLQVYLDPPTCLPLHHSSPAAS